MPIVKPDLVETIVEIYVETMVFDAFPSDDGLAYCWVLAVTLQDTNWRTHVFRSKLAVRMWFWLWYSASPYERDAINLG